MFKQLLSSGFAVASAAFAAAAFAATPSVHVGANGRLQYSADERGNRIPDFSNCGYAGGDQPIPDVPPIVIVEPAPGDDGARIQAAIDHVSQRVPDASGFRGAVMLSAGRFGVSGQLRISESGIVLRGAGAGDGGTVVVATGVSRRPLIHIGGVDDRSYGKRKLNVASEYVPVGSRSLELDQTSGLQVSDRVVVTRPSTHEWIAAVGGDAFGVGWRPGSRDITWDRRIVAIQNGVVDLDAPITTAIEQRFGGGTIRTYEWPGRVENVGVEDLRLESEFAKDSPHDEEHAWFGVTVNHARDVWVRRVEFRHFAGGAVTLLEGASRATVEDCMSAAPISEIGGYRRHTFFTQGQQTLFLRCWSEQGRHDFAAGHAAAGPNAFVNCVANKALAESGPIESWASGVLYDNVRIDGNELRLENRWSSPPGAGWAAANCVLWQCQASTVRCFRPPTANNWAVGTWAEYAGDGTFEARSDFVEPISLFRAQIADRVGEEAAKRVDPLLLDPVGSTNPTLEEAANFTAGSMQSPPQLIGLIRGRMHQAGAESPSGDPSTFQAPTKPEATASAQLVTIDNGWLLIDGKVKTGRRLRPSWWRGTMRPEDAPAFGPSITKFAPGREGVGLTDNLEQVARHMKEAGVAAYDHHYGLWYDRRRDDHLMVRRADGNVAPPFFEQPFARTGRGKAWDGLSRYDLTKWNSWYWSRLREFARLCDQHGLLLFHQHYFQHNILEAGAHWADSPWRPANNVNDTGFPEPPPYVGDKRIFLAEQLYDVSHPRRRELHRRYIRQCLVNTRDSSNAIHFTSAEYSGPLEFVQFWIDVIAEWEEETGCNVLVALSAPKDVQDAILKDDARARHVDVIDIRYWCYAEDGDLYAPVGGQNLAPRQHLRKTRQKPGKAMEIARAIREYRSAYPDKAVTYFAEEHCPSAHDGWAVLMGGASLADVPALPAELQMKLANMKPLENIAPSEAVLSLGDGQGQYLFYATAPDAAVRLEIPDASSRLIASWINKETGQQIDGVELSELNGPVTFREPILWVRPGDDD